MKKNILIVSDQATHPVIGGNRMCMMQYAEILRKLNFGVYFLYIESGATALQDLESTRSYWGKNFYMYKTSRLQYYVQRILARFRRNKNDLCVDIYSPWGAVDYINKLHGNIGFHGLIVNYIWLSKLLKCNIPVKVLYTHDVFSNRNERVKGAEWFSFPVAQEEKALRCCENIFSIQDEESLFFSYLSPKSNIVTVYSSFPYIFQPVTKEKNILFFSGAGSLNVNAIKWFIEEVFPLMLRKDSSIKLLIGGKVCQVLERFSLHGNIELKGFFDNPSDFYLLGDIVINPVSEGSGLKIKTIEAVSHGKAVVVDKHSLKGVYAPDLFPVFPVSSAEQYVDCIISLLGNETQLENIKSSCLSYVQSLNKYIENQYYKLFGDGEK